MVDTLAGTIATLSTTASLGFLGYAAASFAVITGAIALPVLTTFAAISLISIGCKRYRGT